jgi:hypothetical protein
MDSPRSQKMTQKIRTHRALVLRVFAINSGPALCLAGPLGECNQWGGWASSAWSVLPLGGGGP